MPIITLEPGGTRPPTPTEKKYVLAALGTIAFTRAAVAPSEPTVGDRWVDLHDVERMWNGSVWLPPTTRATLVETLSGTQADRIDAALLPDALSGNGDPVAVAAGLNIVCLDYPGLNGFWRQQADLGDGYRSYLQEEGTEAGSLQYDVNASDNGAWRILSNTYPPIYALESAGTPDLLTVPWGITDGMGADPSITITPVLGVPAPTASYVGQGYRNNTTGLWWKATAAGVGTSAWQQDAVAPALASHASTHAPGGADPLILGQNQIEGLIETLAGKFGIPMIRSAAQGSPTMGQLATATVTLTVDVSVARITVDGRAIQVSFDGLTKEVFATVMVSAINGDSLFAATAVAVGAVIHLTSKTAGAAGNALTLSSITASLVLSGPNFSGGSDGIAGLQVGQYARIGDAPGPFVWERWDGFNWLPADSPISALFTRSETPPANTDLLWYDPSDGSLALYDTVNEVWVVIGGGGVAAADILTARVTAVTPTSGTTLTGLATYDETHYVTPLIPLSSLAWRLPTVASSRVGQVKTFFSTQPVTTFNVTVVGGGALVGAALNTAVANEAYSYQCVSVAGAGTWIRLA